MPSVFESAGLQRHQKGVLIVDVEFDVFRNANRVAAGRRCPDLAHLSGTMRALSLQAVKFVMHSHFRKGGKLGGFSAFF